MDGASSEANEENDNIERPVRRRHSSILKPPRSPLQDLRGGNETVQESNALRNKKNSRRVSFADTIKVFQTESHMKIERKSEMAETEAGENLLLIQNKKLEDNYCEITGMNTLLSAPIHTQMQQKEFSIIEHNHERKHANDQTVIFSDENQMDLTSSHTVMITKGLLDNPKSEKSTKIDTTSFLANLKLHTEDSRMKKEVNFSMDQSTSSENKINFNDFIKRLKTGKCNAFPSGPDKENFEIPVYSNESNSASSIHQMHISLNKDESNSNVTRIFREKDDGMNFTQCHTANIQTLIPTSSETNSRESKGNDITIYGNDFMDLTFNHTIQILPATNNFSEIENQTQNAMDVTTGYGTKASGSKINFKSKQNAAFQDPSINPADKIHITRSHMGAETHIVSQTCNQDARILAMTPESVCSNPCIQGCKTVFYSSCNDAMEMTKCLSNVREEKNLLKHDSNYSKMYCNPDAMSCLTEKTIYSGEENMDITKSHTVAIDNQIFKQDQSNVQIAAVPTPEKEMMLQNYMTTSEDGKMNVNCNSLPHMSKERIQQSLSNPLSISLTDRKTELLAGEDMDLTESHTSNLGSQVPLATYNLAPENTSESHSHNKSSSDECEEMTKSHNEPFQRPDMITKNSLTDTWNKDKDRVLKVLPYLDKDSLQSADCNQEIATSHNVVYCGGVLDKQVANRNTVSCEQSLFSTTKPLFSSGQSSMKNHDTTISSHTVKSVLGHNSKLAGPLRKSLSNPTPDCCHDKMIICSEEEQNMDLTKSHTVVIGFGPSELQELGKTNLEHTTSQLTTTSRQIAVKVEKCGKSPTEKSGVLKSNCIMDVLEDESIQKPKFPKEKQNVRIWGRKSVGGPKIDKTIIFSEDVKNDTDITKSYTVEINHRPLLEKHDCHLVPLAGTSETILYTCGQDDMEITRSHTTALECKTVLPDEITTRPMDKTVVFVDNHDELEMTKSHTVFIDYQEKERTDRPNFELSQRKSLGTPKVICTPTEESVFFPENGESDRLVANDSQLTPLEEWSNNRGPVEVADNTELSKSATWKNIKAVQNSGFLNEPLSGKSQRRKSLKLKNDKTIIFSENDKNDMDITQSCMVAIGNKSALENKEDFHLVPFAGASKTILYSCGQDDMEVTRSHTTALECKTVPSNEIAIRPLDKTVLFTDNYNDLEVTNSDTVFIDCQAAEKILEENPKFGIAKGKNLGVSFPKDNSCVQEIAEKQALAVGNKIVHSEQKQQLFASTNKTTNEIVKFHNAAMDEKVIGKVVEQACTLEKAQIESCRLNNRDRRNVGFTSSHATAICGSSDNYSCLPNVISYTDILEGSAMPLCDKDEEKANNCPVQNDRAYANDFASESYLESEGQHLSAPCPLLKKEEVIQTSNKGQLDCVITLHKDQDLIKEPRNLLANQTLVYSQDLGEMTKLNSKRISFKLQKDQMKVFVDDIRVISQPHFSTDQPPLPKKGQSSINKDEVILSKAENKSLNIIGNSSAPICEKPKMLSNEKWFAAACKKELKENIQTTNYNTALDFHSNSDLTKQVIQTHVNAEEAPDPVITSNVPCFHSIKPNLNNLNGKTEEFLAFQTVHIPPLPKQLLELRNKAHNDMSIVQATEICNINIISSNAKDSRDEENKKSHNGAETTCLPSKTIFKDKISDHHTEEDIDKCANSVLTKNLSRTPSSCSSSLDSVKADGTCLDFSTYRSSQMESQFLRDTICEESLREKLQDGRITIREFFILLQVHILIQKPRQSNLPGNFTINTPPTPEDLMLSQYVYRPKIQIYREDCEARRQKIEELKLSALNQDKLLADINKNLWEKMRHCSDDELKAFGIYLNKIKSRFTKMTKVFTHQGKVALYGKLVQSAQNEKEKLQIKIDEMDKILKKIDNCLSEMETETKNLEDEEKDNPVDKWDSEMRAAEKELEQLKTEEEELQRNLLELEVQKEQTLAQIDFMQKQRNRTEELLDQLSLSEWDVVEWSDDQAVFTFVYDTVQLTITFEESVVGLPFLDKRYRKIVDVNFQSLLDEDQAPPSSLLVHKLIFQYVEEKESWKKTCRTQHQVPKMLEEFSLVVHHCRLLGEEIEYLKRWGPNYNLMNIDVNNTELRLLFSSSAAFAKFEITLSLSAYYPSVPLPSTIQNHIGNTSQDDIAAILSKVPLENNYLKNVVKQIYQDLFQDCHFYH
ncbi:kinetochore scaffold 1 isoform X2 [Macaca thibetana thibetana]|uniref:kinetochore scaffold 1 isoform X2 n=1 Tax=Macaca thibetana thibetana TaxID=257877 RepID=UPI0021BC6578|nr:kinetochore scaffold 1 isoform X2 [Macaca thibetana thibetana]